MAGVEVSCPKCGNLCKTQELGCGWLLMCGIVGVIAGIFTFGIGLVLGIIIALLYKNSLRNKPIECLNCGHRWLP